MRRLCCRRDDALEFVDRIGDGTAAAEIADPFLEAFGAQDVARRRMRADEPQAYPCRLQLRLHVLQHARAGEVNGGRYGQIAYHEFRRFGTRANFLPDRLTHVFSVEVKQRRFGTENQYARSGFVVRVAFHVGEAARARNAAEEGHMPG